MGASLARAGETVALVVRPETLASYPPRLHVDSTFGKWSVEVEWAATVPPVDVLWLAVKAPQLDSALRSITGASMFAAMVPLLNGVEHVELLRSKYGVERVIPATIAGEFERASIGHIVHRTPFARLNVSSRGRGLLQRAFDQLQSIGFTCNFVDDEATLMWSKLVFLAPLALTTTAFDKTIGELVAGAETWQPLQAAVREACAAGVAEGARVDAGPVLEMIKGLPGNMRSSMQKDVAHGRQPELDAIGGPIVRAAKHHGLIAPITEALMAQIERAGKGSRQAS